MAITDANEDEVVSYRYDPYGMVTITRGGTPQSSDPLGQPWMFGAQFYDGETSTYYGGLSYFHPEDGHHVGAVEAAGGQAGPVPRPPVVPGCHCDTWVSTWTTGDGPGGICSPSVGGGSLWNVTSTLETCVGYPASCNTIRYSEEYTRAGQWGPRRQLSAYPTCMNCHGLAEEYDRFGMLLNQSNSDLAEHNRDFVVFMGIVVVTGLTLGTGTGPALYASAGARFAASRAGQAVATLATGTGSAVASSARAAAGPRTHMHHIVARGHPVAGAGREVLRNFGVPINHPSNLVRLDAHFHLKEVHGTWRDQYYPAVNGLVDKATSADHLFAILKQISEGLQGGCIPGAR